MTSAEQADYLRVSQALARTAVALEHAAGAIQELTPLPAPAMKPAVRIEIWVGPISAQ